jgi:heme exporter protein C
MIVLKKIKEKSIEYLKPKNLKKISNFAFKPLLISGFIFVLYTFLYVSFFIENDYEQGYIFKMLYVHVPTSWWALGIYVIMAFLGIIGFITRMPQFHIMATCWLMPGLTFTIFSLLSGMIWGKLTWGTFWVWDARLTTMFLHFLIYLSYALFIYSSKHKNETSLAIGSVLLIIGLVNLPLIKWSVDWWFTLHQSSSLNAFGKNTIHQTYFIPLLIISIGFFLWALGIFFLKLKNYFKD